MHGGKDETKPVCAGLTGQVCVTCASRQCYAGPAGITGPGACGGTGRWGWGATLSHEAAGVFLLARQQPAAWPEHYCDSARMYVCAHAERHMNAGWKSSDGAAAMRKAPLVECTELAVQHCTKLWPSVPGFGEAPSHLG